MWSIVKLVLKNCWVLQSPWGQRRKHRLLPSRGWRKKGRSTYASPNRKRPCQAPVLMNLGLQKDTNDLKGSELHIGMRTVKMCHAILSPWTCTYFDLLWKDFLLSDPGVRAVRVKRRRDGFLCFFRQKSKKILHLDYLIPINSNSAILFTKALFRES